LKKIWKLPREAKDERRPAKLPLGTLGGDMPAAPDARRAKGTSFIGAAKILRSLQRKAPISGLSPAALAILEEHALPTSWYPWPPVSELIEAVVRLVLNGSEEGAIQMGIAGGKEAFSSYHKTFIREDDTLATLVATQHSWKMYFDFGELTARADGNRSVRFTLAGYPDCTPGHGSMIVGWHRASAIVGGATNVRGQILECPWRGSSKLVHRVDF
jgi:hypothetical protein